MLNKNLTALWAVFIFFTPGAYAQEEANKGSFKFLSYKFHSGQHFYTGSQLKDRLKHGYKSFEARAGWQTHGKHEWEGYFNYPSYGIGTYIGFVGDIEIFGNPNAVFGFMAFPISKRKRNFFQIEPALGLTYNLKPYNAKTNESNDAIGARMAVYFSIHAGGRYRFTREMDFLYGLDATHFSNGRSSQPNLGLNMLGLSAGLCYHYNGRQRKVDNALHPKVLLEARPYYPAKVKVPRLTEDNISLYQAFGVVQNMRKEGTNHRYLTSSTVLEYQHKFNPMHAVSVGGDFFYDRSAKDTAEYHKNTSMQTFFPAAHIGYDFMFWRLQVKLQIGAHLSSMGRELKSTTFIRPAVRYEANKRFFLQLGLKTRKGSTADWVEFGAGYKLMRLSKKS